MKVEEYRAVVHEDIELASKVNNSDCAEEFLLYAIGILSVGEEFDDFVECHYEGLTRRNGRMCIDGFARNDSDGICNIFICDYHGPDDDDSVKADDINASFKKIRLFVEEAVRRELYHELESNSQIREFATDLFYENDISKYRFFLLTDAYNRQRAKNLEDEKVNGIPVELSVWDINRLFELVSNKIQKESVEIIFSDYHIKGLPCVKAVEYDQVVADIEVVPSFDNGDLKENDNPENVITYSSYLAVIPGQLLSDLYREYGARLLEGNVRAFLSVRGKVNKSIRNTIKNYPEMFFAYNNGIAATATELDTEMTADGPVITRIKDLQIVNGGQTTASIANTILSAKKSEIVDVSSLFVPMKISVLEYTMAEKIIPKISKYSNSQNKVDDSDFFSNHPFHIRMEEYSRKTSIPSLRGNQFQQYWFYERTRGQYNQEKLKRGIKGKEVTEFKKKFPENQIISMLDLARYMEIYNCSPEIVSRGKQKTLKAFADEVEKEWQKSDEKYNAFYYKRMVSIGILYKKTDDIIKNSDWYKTRKSYKANVIAYTLSLIFYYIRVKKKGYEMDFKRIWNVQDIYEELEDQIRVLTWEVYNYITGPRDTENVTEWCKKETCWIKAKSQMWTFNDPFVRTLVPVSGVNAVKKEEKATRKLANEVDALKEIMARGSDYWRNLLKWGMTKRLLSEKEMSIIKMIINMNITGRIPTDKQAKVVIKARDRLIKEGMPLQF